LLQVAGFSDGAGRRPAFFICFVIHIAANIGLGAQNSYAALMVLRCLAGSSGTIALSTGIAADVVSAAERGSYVAIASPGALLGPILGPIIGGLISQFLDWHWIFWFLPILAGAVFVPLMLFFPETNRKVVGDGSYPPPLQCQSLTGVMIARSLKKRGVDLNPEKQESLRRNYKIRFSNPFATLVMAFDKACFIILLGNGLVVANMYIIPVGVTSLFHATYGFNQIQIALCFLPFGAGSIVSSYIAGRLLDRSYKKHALRLGLPVVRNRRQDLGNFPIKRARRGFGFPMVYAGMAVTIAYGRVLQSKTNLAGPLVLMFFIGVTNMGSYQAMNTLMIDNFPEKAATATAANKLFRCLLGAGAPGRRLDLYL
jgi:MFS family permease